jgi:hypothetical protein
MDPLKRAEGTVATPSCKIWYGVLLLSCLAWLSWFFMHPLGGSLYDLRPPKSAGSPREETKSVPENYTKQSYLRDSINSAWESCKESMPGVDTLFSSPYIATILKTNQSSCTAAAIEHYIVLFELRRYVSQSSPAKTKIISIMSLI